MADDRRPGDTDLHRSQRGKNVFVAVCLVLMAVAFFALTIVRMSGQG